MNNYGEMNEEQLPNSGENFSMPNSQDYIIDNVVDSQTITVYLKITDSDIRTIQINSIIETVGSLKIKVT